jgi:hypothetical protein
MAAGGDPGNLTVAVAAVTLCLCYARFAARRLRPGLPRLAALLSVLATLPFPRSASENRGCWRDVWLSLVAGAGWQPVRAPVQ